LSKIRIGEIGYYGSHVQYATIVLDTCVNSNIMRELDALLALEYTYTITNCSHGRTSLIGTNRRNRQTVHDGYEIEW